MVILLPILSKLFTAAPRNLSLTTTDVFIVVGVAFTFTCSSTSAVPVSVYEHGKSLFPFCQIKTSIFDNEIWPYYGYGSFYRIVYETISWNNNRMKNKTEYLALEKIKPINICKGQQSWALGLLAMENVNFVRSNHFNTLQCKKRQRNFSTCR